MMGWGYGWEMGLGVLFWLAGIVWLAATSIGIWNTARNMGRLARAIEKLAERRDGEA